MPDNSLTILPEATVREGLALSGKANWRTGGKVSINVYEGDTPVCQCQNADYATQIVHSVNHYVSLANEVLARREAMEDAPHDSTCSSRSGRTVKCNCWKAKWSAK